jgi:hypothetical protein
VRIFARIYEVRVLHACGFLKYDLVHKFLVDCSRTSSFSGADPCLAHRRHFKDYFVCATSIRSNEIKPLTSEQPTVVCAHITQVHTKHSPQLVAHFQARRILYTTRTNAAAGGPCEGLFTSPGRSLILRPCSFRHTDPCLNYGF